MQDRTQSPSLGAQDLVVPLYNAVLTLEAYVAASSSVDLPPQITSDPTYQTLIDQFENWQGSIWNEFYSSLLNAQILAEAQEINAFFQSDKILPVPPAVLQKQCQSSLFQPGQTASIVQRSCVQYADLVAEGTGFITQLDQVVDGFTKSDAAAVKAALEQVNTLNQQFQSEEEAINKDMLGADKTIVSTIVKVNVDLGLMAIGDEEADPLKPLKEGVIQVGKDVGKAIYVDTQVGATLTALESAMEELDEDEYKLFQVLLVRQQLAGLTAQTEPALRALARIGIEWGVVADTVAAPADDWKNRGMAQVGSWASLMQLLKFEPPTTQTISYDGTAWTASTD